MAVILELPEQRWTCPNCTSTEVTRGEANRFHYCPGLAGILAPMVPEGTDCTVRALEREDFVGDELVQYDGNGRPIMSLITERPDGTNDLIVNVPTARVGADSHGMG